MIETPRQKIDSLQVGRAFAAQFVVLYHVNAVMTSRLGMTVPSDFARAGHSGVDFFFVLSGFIIAFVHWRDVGQPERAGRYFYRRITRIYPVFWVVLLLTALAQILTSQLEPDLRSVSGVLRAIFLVPFETYPPVVVAWTLSHELLFYLFFGVMIFFGRLGLIAMCLWWCLVLWVLVSGQDLAFPMSFIASPYNLLFGFGILAAMTYRNLSKPLAWASLIGGLVFFGTTIWADQILDPAWRTVSYGIGAALIVAGSVRLERLTKRALPRLLIFLGDASYSIYLIHSLSMAFAAVVILKLGLSDLPLPILAVSLFCIGNIGGLALYTLVERPLMARFKHSRKTARSTAWSK